jgi:hypothetical protein
MYSSGPTEGFYGKGSGKHGLLNSNDFCTAVLFIKGKIVQVLSACVLSFSELSS